MEQPEIVMVGDLGLSALSQLPDPTPAQLNSVKWEWVDGKAIYFACTDGKCFPTDEQQNFGEMFCYDLNEQFHFDGRWRVVWRDPVKSMWDKIARRYVAYYPTLLEFQWLDADGDPIFVVESDKSFDKILDEYESGEMFHRAEVAHKTSMEMLHRHFQVDASMQYRPSKGEKAKDITQQATPLSLLGG